MEKAFLRALERAKEGQELTHLDIKSLLAADEKGGKLLFAHADCVRQTNVGNAVPFREIIDINI